MKKLIILTNGQERQAKEMTIEEVITNYSKLIRRTIITYVGYEVFSNNAENLMQEGNIICWKAFESYDEQHCFSTHLEWQLKGRLQQIVKAKKTKKRDDESFKTVNINDSTSFDSTKTYEEYIADESITFEEEHQSNELIKYLKTQIKEDELDLLSLNLGYTTITELAAKTGKTKASVSYRNKRFKSKLVKIITNYNTIQ